MRKASPSSGSRLTVFSAMIICRFVDTVIWLFLVVAGGFLTAVLAIGLVILMISFLAGGVLWVASRRRHRQGSTLFQWQDPRRPCRGP